MSDITVGSVAVDIVPDTRGFAEKLKAKLADLTADIRITADTTEARAQIEELTRSRSTTINANADTTEAEAQLDAVARTREAGIRADASGISGLVAGALALGPALIPVTAAITGLVAALGAPLAVAGGGLTVFGVISGMAIKSTEKQKKQIDDLKKKVDAAKLSLSQTNASIAASSSPNSASADARRAAAQKKVTDAVAAYHVALSALSPAQKRFLTAQEALKESFHKLITAAGPAVFGPFTAAMRALAALMPRLAPILHSVSSALSSVLLDIKRSVQGGQLGKFIDTLGTFAGPMITTFAVVLENIATGFVGLLAAFTPLAGGLLNKVSSLSSAFADFGRTAGTNKGLQSFIAYVQQVGPQVAAVLGEVITAVVHLAVALAPIGSVSLGSIGVIAKIISAIPTDVILSLVAGFIAYAAAIRIITPLIKAWAVVQAILDGELALNPIGIVVVALAALVAELVYAYKNSETFRAIVQAAFEAVAKAVDFAKDHWKLLIALLLGPFGAAIIFVVDHLHTVENVARTVFKFIVDAFLSLVGAIVHGAAKAFGWVPGIGPKLKAAASAFDDFRDRVNAALDGIQSLKVIHLDVQVTKSTNATVGEAAAAPRKRASGGPVVAGRTYLVGERGPELVKFPASGEVVPNHALGSEVGGIDHEQATYRGFSRALRDGKVVVVPRDTLTEADLQVGVL